MEVQAWDKPSDVVVGTANVHAGGSSAVADPRIDSAIRNPQSEMHPRIPADNERPDPVPVIISLDNTWHRPLTTLELAVLQSFPTTLPDGRPLVLSGKSDGKWRERIGNAVPPETARAIAVEILKALLMNGKLDFMLHSEPVWVKPVKEVRA
jgi:site-specific DNA-cytosine methylase